MKYRGPHVTIFTDGSWKGSWRTGGYVALITDDYGNWRLIGDGSTNTTISRMELSAAIAGLSCLYDGCDVSIIADSMYVVNIINKWAKLWTKNHFKKTDGKPVANVDALSLLIHHMNRMSRVRAYHIKSHTGYTDTQSLGNEIVDNFAVQQAGLAYGLPLSALPLQPV